MSIQLPFMVVQLLLVGSSRSASLVTFTVNWRVSSLFSLSFPKPVPDGTRVPLWAYMPSWVRAFPSDLCLLVQDVSSTVSLQVGDDWDSTAAQIAGGARHFGSVHTHIFLCHSDSPEVTGSVVMTSASQFPYSPTSLASSSLSTFSPTASRSASSPTSSHTASGSASSSTSTSHSSNRGEMEGSVVGGIVGATLIFGIVVWFVRRRRARSAPSTTDTSDEMEQPVAYQPLTIKTPKLYVSLYSLTLYHHQVWGESCNYMLMCTPRTLRIQPRTRQQSSSHNASVPRATCSQARSNTAVYQNSDKLRSSLSLFLES
jgi:hypothetical protein